MPWRKSEQIQLEDRLQQPLTAIRLMVEGALYGVVETSPDMLGKVLFCLAEMQDILDAAGDGGAERATANRIS